MNNLTKFGYYKLLAISPRLYVGNVKKNVEEILRICIENTSKKAAVMLFPELSLVGYSAEDLLHTESVLKSTRVGLLELAGKTKSIRSLIVVGLPLEHQGRLYNGVACLFEGKVVSFHSKTFLPNYKEFYENRWFTEGYLSPTTIEFNGYSVPFSNSQILKLGDLNLGIEVCEDVWNANTPSTNLALAGAELILNLSASNELVAKAQFRRQLLQTTSARLNCGYLYASSGPWESSKDLLFGGYLGYFEDGSLLKEDTTYSFETKVLEIEIDIEKIRFERRKNTTFGKNHIPSYSIVKIGDVDETLDIKRSISPTPFIPQGDTEREKRVIEILDIQSMALARRLLSIGKNTKMVLGLSGGLDSTLAMLVGIKACEKLGLPTTTLHTISMPGFGTSDRTKNQAQDLANAFNTTFKEIEITKATTQHLIDIDHKLIDFVYENAQARERTQILFDYANKVGGFVLNTSSLSESYLGWSTMGADQTGNYGVNASIPKSLTRFMIQFYPALDHQKDILKRVYETPISPELLPLDSKKEISQKTEDILGPYELIDFYIFYAYRNGFVDDKVLFLAKKSFDGKYKEEFMSKVFKNSYKRFRLNQFKRTAAVSSVKIGVSVSQRGDLRLPDEYEGEEN